jgi:hypothetical protein
VDNNKYSRMRQMDLNEPVTITLPAHIWLGYMASYGAARWTCGYASVIMAEVREALFDPLVLKEQEAAEQRHNDRHNRLFSSMLPGFKPPGDDDIPPDASELPDS